MKANDGDINHPAYYNTGKIEVITVIEDWNLDFYLGNALKYIARAGRKNKAEYITDLGKAIWYLDRLIELESRRTGDF